MSSTASPAEAGAVLSARPGAPLRGTGSLISGCLTAGLMTTIVGLPLIAALRGILWGVIQCRFAVRRMGIPET
jgi:hypothetical protein